MSQLETTILLLSAEGNLPYALRRAKGRVLIIAMDVIAIQAAKAASVAWRSADDYLKISEAELYSASHKMALDWYQLNGVDYSQFNSCSLAELVYIELGLFYIFELMRKITIVDVIYSEEAPTAWVLSTGQNALWESIIQNSAAKSITLYSVAPTIMKWWRRYVNFNEIKLWLRRQGLDYLARAWVAQIERWVKPQTLVIPDKAPYLFVVDIPVTSVLGTLIPIIREVPPEDRLVISTDPRCTKALMAAGIVSLNFDIESLGVKKFESDWASQKQTRTSLERNWSALDAVLSQLPAPSMQFRGVDLWPLCRHDFRNFFLRRMPQAYQHYQLACAVFNRYQVKVVITASDSHYMGMLFVRAAEREGRRSLAIQHGMVNYPEGYLPVRATQMAVMGEGIKEWLLNFGAKSDQIVVTGQPRFDALLQSPSVDRTTLLAELDLQPEVPTWLIAPEPRLGLWMHHVLFDALDMLPDVQAVVRIHPVDNPMDYQQTLEIYPSLRERVRLSRTHDVLSALNACDVLILGRSTLGLEALLLGKSLIIVCPPDKAAMILPPYLHDYLDSMPHLYAQSSGELTQAWASLQHDEAAERVKQAKKHIVQRYACGGDGYSTRRVFEAARCLACEVEL